MIKEDTYILGYKIYSEGIKKIIEKMKREYNMTEQINSHITLIYLGKTNNYNKEMDNHMDEIKQLKINGVCLDFIGRSIVLRLNIEQNQYKKCRECITKYEKAKHAPFLHITLGSVDRDIDINERNKIINNTNLRLINKIEMSSLDVIKIDHINNNYIKQNIIN